MSGRFVPRLIPLVLLSLAVPGRADAQLPVTSRQIRDAASTGARPGIGDTVTVAGRVTLGSRVLDTVRLRLYVQDSAGGVYIYGTRAQRTLDVRVGDSVLVRGVIARYRDIMEVGDARVTVIPVPLRSLPPLVLRDHRRETLEAADWRLVTLTGTVARTRFGGRPLLIQLSSDADPSDPVIDVIELPNAGESLRLDRFTSGDPIRVTGVLGKWRDELTDEMRYTLYPRSRADLVAMELTRAQGRRLLWAITLAALVAMAMVWRIVAWRSAAARERQRLAAARALSDSEERFRLVSQATKDIVWEWNLVTHRMSWSEGAHSVFGHSLEELGDTITQRLATLHQDDRERVRASLERSIANPALNSWSDEYRYQRADGSYATVFDRAYIIRDGEGRARRMVGAMQDLSSRLELEEQLRQAQKMEAVGQLAAGVAHDFNNILTAIGGFSELVLADLPPDSPSRTDVAQIQLAGARAAALTRQLLTFSRREPVRLETVDVNSVITENEQLLRRTLGGQVILDLELCGTPCTTVGDRGQLTQVLMNLVINARDAMNDVGGIVTIETAVVAADALPARARTPRPGAHVRLVVRDTGTGIAENIRERIFEPFFTTKAAGAGTGLGLSSVYGIVTRAGGAVYVDSAVGVGSAFTILLPFEQADAVASAAQAPASLAERESGVLLLVEDDAPVRVSVKRRLQARGFEVLEAQNATDALTLWQQVGGAVKAVISDVMMPGMSGPELVKMLRQERPELPVIFVSGYTEYPLDSLGGAPGHTVFLPKPFDLEHLARELARLLTLPHAFLHGATPGPSVVACPFARSS